MNMYTVNFSINTRSPACKKLDRDKGNAKNETERFETSDRLCFAFIFSPFRLNLAACRGETRNKYLWLEIDPTSM